MTEERFELLGGSTIVEVTTATPTVTVLGLTLQPGGGAGEHTHTKESETIIVLEGTLDVSGRLLQPGDATHLPVGTSHSFANHGDAVVRALVVCVPGGLERFFRAVASPDATEESVAAAVEAAGLRFN
jgi:quercetin dioxygenase-like cupin family protein